VFSVLGVFWGSLTGYDEFILIDSASGFACAFPAEDCFDAYGYISETGTELINGIASGSYISPDEASVSEDGQSLLLLGGGRVFVMDTVTLEITEPALPDGFSGTVGWEGNELYAVSDSGVKTALTLGWQTGDEWTMGSDFGSESGFDVDWSAPGSGDLGDWS